MLVTNFGGVRTYVPASWNCYYYCYYYYYYYYCYSCYC